MLCQVSAVTFGEQDDRFAAIRAEDGAIHGQMLNPIGHEGGTETEEASKRKSQGRGSN